MKIRIAAYVITLIFFTCTIYAQQFPDTYFESRYGKLEYGFYVPKNNDITKKYPLIMYLHGMGNNYSVYLNWYNNDIQAKNPCFVFTPKTPISWADWSGWWDKLTEPMAASLHVLDSLISVYPVDTDRIYVYGISMGGEGVFDLLHKYPNKFAAAMSVCGGGQPSWAENISQTPFWMFHGSADNTNPPKLTEQVYEAMVKLGAKRMRYKNYPGYGHEIWNVAASEPSWYDWLFSHSKKDTSALKPTKPIQLTAAIIVNNKIKFSWNDIRNADERENKIWYYKIYNKERLIGTTEYNNQTFEFPATNSLDTFCVSAVNYHFKESSRSNNVYYRNGSIATGISNNFSAQRLNLSLHQNYPNPFNPATTIKYSIAKQSYVTIKIYDVIGRELATIVNEEKSAGDYETKFNAAGLSSGIYFYRMQAGDFLETKKLILVK